ncbi:hypothetical protein MMC20_006102 [Loxospora ochrophaea]|nr:hypothetical protein [Loxospora ochrophaea]
MGWDDYVMILSTIAMIIGAALDIPEVIAGVGRHTYYLTPPKIAEAVKYNHFSTLFTVLSLWLSKISICLFLLRILDNSQATKRRYALYMIMVIYSVASIICLISLLAQCRPLSRVWDPLVPGVCLNQLGFGYAQSISSLVFDFVLSIFPCLIFSDLNMKLRVKIGLCAVMGLGLATGAFAIIKTVLLGRFEADDITYNIVPLVIWATLEQNVAIIAACIPPLRPLFSYFNLGTQNSASRYRNRHGYSAELENGHSLSNFLKKATVTSKTAYSTTGPCETESEQNRSSKEQILPAVGIRKTTEVNVSREGRSAGV